MKELETSVHLTNRKEDNTCGWQRARGREEEKVGELAETQVMEVVLYIVGTLDFTQRDGRPQQLFSRRVI